MRSEGTSRRFGEVGPSERVSRAFPWRHRARVAKCVRRCEMRIGRLIEKSTVKPADAHSGESGARRYRGTAEVNAVRALQIATHSPIDESDMTIKDAALISRRWTARSPSVRTGGRLSTE